MSERLGVYAMIFVLCSLLCAPVCAKKKPRKNQNANETQEVTETEDEATSAVAGDAGTAINIPHQRLTYFGEIDSNTLHLMEIGTPASLRSAVAAMQIGEQTQKVRVLMAVADSIMRLVWKSEDVQWKVPPITEDTPYTGALQSAAEGIYDTSTGNQDFLALVLPSVVAVAGGDVMPYADAAQSALQEGLELRPDSVLAQYLLAVIYTKTGRPADALPLLQKAYREYNGKEVAFALQHTLSTLGRKEEASAMARELVTRWPQDIEVLRTCAESAYNAKDYNGAEGYAQRLLQQDPRNAEFILFRARVLVALGDYIRATSMLDMYSRQNTTAADYLLLRAQVLRDWSGNMGAATAVAEDALARYPKNSDVLLLAASLASATGSLVGGKNASQLADEALLLDPNSEEALKYKINALVSSGEWQKAYKESAWYLRSHASDRAAAFTHIRICLELKKNDEAWTLVSPLYRENSGDEEVIKSYVTVLVRTGRTSEASAIIKDRLDEATPNMRSFYYYERSLMQSSQEASLADLRSALIAWPRNKEALYRLYQIYYAARDYRKAQYYLKQVIALDRGNAAMRRLDEDLQRLIR